MRPVALLHGALRSPLGLWPTARSLARQGLDPRPFGYTSRHGTVEDHAARIEAALLGWLGDEPLTSLGLLTHSMGGLVARALLARPAIQRRAPVQRLVMLAPPNAGSALAARWRSRRSFRLVYGDAAEALQPERVAALPLPPPSCRCLILVGGTGDDRGYNTKLDGDNDGLVATAEAGLPGVAPRFVGGVHSLLQWRPAVLECAADFLLADAGSQAMD